MALSVLQELGRPEVQAEGQGISPRGQEVSGRQGRCQVRKCVTFEWLGVSSKLETGRMGGKRALNTPSRGSDFSFKCVFQLFSSFSYHKKHKEALLESA